MKLILSCFFVVVLGMAGQSQKSIHTYDLDKKSLLQFNEAVKLSRSNQPEKAIKEFEKIYKKFPTLHEAPLRIATIHFEKKDYAMAKKLFDEVITKDKDYDAEIYFSAGMIAYESKNYTEGEKYFDEYIWRNENDNAKTAKAIKLKNDCQFRAHTLKHPKTFSPVVLSNFINSTDSEFLPNLSLDGRTLIFTRRVDNINEEIFFSTKDDNGNWSIAVPLENVNSRFNESAAALSEDGSVLIFTKCEDKTTGHGSCDLYMVKKNNDEWGIPQNLGDKINTPGWESQPCITDNGQTIIFSSDRKGGSGNKDLWMISRTRTGKWGHAVNLGENVNSSGNEESPFLHPDGKTLYFRSDGHPGMGSFDIFISRWDEVKHTWGKAINFGFPINTEGSEGALFVATDGATAFFASDVLNKVGDKKNLDIFQFELPTELRSEPVSYVRLKVLDAVSKNTLHPHYTLTNLGTGDTIMHGNIDNESLLFALRQNHNYAFHVNQPDYIFHSENFNTQEASTFKKEVLLKIELQPIKKTLTAEPVVLNNVFFKSGSSELLKESNFELEKLVHLLTENAALNIQITGHTDDVGNNDANLLLSQNRAKAVVEFLVQKGINKSRLSFEGKGESSPIADNATELGRSKNRRTEFIIVP